MLLVLAGVTVPVHHCHSEMQSSLRFQASNPGVVPSWKNAFTGNIHAQRNLLCTKRHTLPKPLCSLTVQSHQPPHYTSTVGSSPPLHLSHWNLTQRHLTVLQVFACVVPSLSLSIAMFVTEFVDSSICDDETLAFVLCRQGYVQRGCFALRFRRFWFV